MKKLSLITFAITVAFTRCCPDHPCRDRFITPAFIGFEVSDLDTIIVRQYEKDGNFVQLVDTALLTFDTAFLKSEAAVDDTTFVLLNNIVGSEKYIFPDHDWQIYLPANNLIISISNIESPKTEGCSLSFMICLKP